jgi:hypothetical protein
MITLADLKTMLQISDSKRDGLLNLILKNTDKALLFKLGLKPADSVPDELSYIELEVCIRRFNRLTNEGMASYSQEGLSITFNSNDFDDFAQDISDWKDANGKTQSSLGVVSFINGWGD